jgi:type I restriction enzyme, S subunit
MSVEWHKLGEFVESCDERNSTGVFNVGSVRGISTGKELIPTAANLSGVSLSTYKIASPGQFAYVSDTSRRGDKLSLGFNQYGDSFLVSSISTVFSVSDERLLPTYLYLWFCRPEFDRYARFHSWGSARETFSFAEMQRVEIPVPSIEEQKKVVEAWQGLRKMKEQNEQLAEPLLALCRSYLQDCKNKYEMVEIGGLIEPLNERNRDDAIKAVRGMSTEKEFRVPQSRVDFDNLTNYKIVRHHDFVFVPTTDTWRCLAICLSRDDVPFLVSPIYEVFRFSDEQKVMPEFFHLWCKRQEFDRYARYNSWGSARENFSLADMCRVKIPLPPLDVQQAIVDVYRCANDAKRIAAEADRLSREICPALIRHVVNED